MNFLKSVGNSVAKTADKVGHQVGQYVDAHAAGGLLDYFSTGNVVCLVCKATGKALQIVVNSEGHLVVDGIGMEGPQAFNTHWTIVNEGNNIIRLHNNNNYLCLNHGNIGIIACPQGKPMGSETTFRVSQPNDHDIVFESVKEPGKFVLITPSGQPDTHYKDRNFRHFVPRLIYSPYGPMQINKHSYKL